MRGKFISNVKFEEAYAERSSITLKQLHALGMAARPCSCGDKICQGWQMVNAQQWEADRASGLLVGSLANSWLYE